MTILTLNEYSNKLELGLESNLYFILSHFEEPIWPRNIAVNLDGKTRVYLVNNKQEALARFKQANLLDCRISAYPDYVEFEGINRQPPNFIFIDIDRSTFNTDRAFNMAVNRTRKNIKEMLGENPTIILTGNGVHFYQPVKLVYKNVSVLEQLDVFSEFVDVNGRKKKDLSTRFMRFAEELFAGSKHDPSHNPSIKSCLVRVPHTLNSKCIDLQTGNYIKDPEVKIIQRWDGQRPAINYILRRFRSWLINDAIKEKLEVQSRQDDFRKLKNKWSYGHYNNNSHNHHYYYDYIEKLLQTPIKDFRKRASSLVIIPYLVVVKKLESDQEVFNIARAWLDRCNEIEALDRGYDYNYRIRSSIASSRKGQIPPMGLERFKEENRELYDMLVKQQYWQ